MGIIRAEGIFAAAQRMAEDEREHPTWCRSLKTLRKLVAYSEAIVGPHPGVFSFERRMKDERPEHTQTDPESSPPSAA